ncbi:DNA-binding protein [Pseudomonas marincola]|uniref:DNA-binding protein n=1 Tax=Pseudomonas marincola TaxID=437900 RepID=A0A653E684_9PSED|nr:DUF4055 domain-containing protein [Pseudomonas marincola]CAE6906648.1 DNA-binding protein [Pseudomonas marincola]
MANDPSTVSAAVSAMREDWAIVDALMGGTKAMRAASTKFLPKWPKEEQDAYEARLSLSTLLPAYSETISNMTGRVFAEPITLGDDVPKEIAAFSENIDRQGNNLQVWAQELFRTGLDKGLCHVFVDYPKTKDVKTRADEIALGARPYAVIIRPGQVLGWKSDSRNGEQMLSQFRYMESVEEQDPDNEFALKSIDQIRVLEVGKWTTYRKTESTDKKVVWAVHEEGTTSLKHIPLATYYTKRTGFMTATPPLLELGHLNIKHWQSQSDQDNILHVARVPMLMVSGIDDDEWELKIGTSAATKLPVGGDMKWVEHTGKAIDAGRVSLQDLVDDMRIAGAKLLYKEKQATKTATQAEEESAQEMSPLETMAGQLEDCIDQVFQYFAEYLKLESGGSVKVEGNFEVDYDQQTTLPFLLNMNAAGKLSDESLFSEIKRRGVLADELDWEEEKERIEGQGPALGTF